MGNEISMLKDADSQSSPSSPSPYDDLRSNPDSADSTSSYTESNDNNGSGGGSLPKPRKFFSAVKFTRSIQRKKPPSQGNDESSTASSRSLRRKTSQSSNSQDEFSPASPNTCDEHFEALKPVPRFFSFSFLSLL